MLVVSALCWHSYSYSEYVYQSSSNAASAGYDWVMKNVLPQYTGLAVNGVVYQYTTVKNPEDAMVVTIQNQNAVDGGYIFREQDDWTGQPANTISKAIVVPYIPIEYWGDGSITIDGEGQVVDQSVIYTYRYDDTCIVTPQSDPSCPGYQEIEVDTGPTYVAQDFTQDEMDRQQTFRDEQQEREDFLKMLEEEKRKIRLQDLEERLGNLSLNAMQGPAELLHMKMIAMNYLSPEYAAQLVDAVYEETITLEDSELPDNRRARRNNLLQQKLHQELVELQYKGE